jgi:hypothetical protein
LGKQGRLDYVNFGTYVPAFKPLPKVHDYTLLFTRNGRAPYILGCVAEIVTANGWKTFIPVAAHARGRHLGSGISRKGSKHTLRLFELVRVLMRLDHVGIELTTFLNWPVCSYVSTTLPAPS